MNVTWIVDLVFALLSVNLFGMAGLVAARLLRDRLDARRARLRGQAIQSLIGLVLSPEPMPAARLERLRADPRLMAEVVLELQVLVRGPERERAFACLRELGLAELFIRRFRRGRRTGRLYAEALSALGGPEAAGALECAALAHPNPDVKITALRFVVAEGRQMDFQALMRDAAAGRIPPSLPFAELLRQIARIRPRDVVQAAQDPELPVSIRALLFDALGSSGDYGALEHLVIATFDPRLEIRIAGVRGLGKLMHPAAAPAIERLLQDREWAVRTAAAEAAGRSKLAGLSDRLAAMLADPEWWVRFRAAEALKALGEPGLERLRAAADGAAPAARAAAQAMFLEAAA
jgi:hypothetical protein